jgi:hypothetical protein
MGSLRKIEVDNQQYSIKGQHWGKAGKCEE